MTINLKTATPDTSLPTTGFLFGADSQAAASPSVYSAGSVRDGMLLDPVFMGLYVSSSASTSIAVAGTYYKMAGTTTVTNKSDTMDDDSSTSNRIKFLGTTARHFHIVAQVSISPDTGSNQVLGIKVWYYDSSAASGSYLPESEARTIVSAAGANIEQITTHGDVTMDTNDYLELHVTNETSTNAVTASNAYLFACAMNGNW